MNASDAHDPIVLASAYRLTAVVYWENAKRLREGYEATKTQITGNRLTIPFYYMVSHAAELLLKSALLKRGHTRRDLMYPEIRHNLNNLMHEIISKKVAVSCSSKSLISLLEGQHKQHDLRYNFLMPGERVHTPDPDRCFATLEELLMLTRISTHGS